MGLIIIFVFFGFCALIAYLIYDEARSNDSFPTILSKNVSMQRINDVGINTYNSNENKKESNVCSSDEQKRASLFLKGKENFEIQEQYVTCHKFATTKGVFYDIFPGMSCRATLLLEKAQNDIEYVIKDGSSKDPIAGYPCNGFVVLLVNNDSITITFSGWRNPKKIVKLTIQ